MLAGAVSAICYSPESYEEVLLKDAQQLADLRLRHSVVWVNVDVLDPVTVEEIGEAFGIHRLALSAVLEPNQRPKVELYGGTCFVIVRLASYCERLATEQVSMFCGPDFVLTFQEEPGDCFQQVRVHCRRAGSRLRSMGADYLMYSLLDAIIDSYFPLLELYDERLEDLEQEAFATPGKDTIADIHQVKRELLTLRRSAWPHREVINALTHEDMPVAKETRMYMRDCYQRTIQVIDLMENYREIAASLTEGYLSTVSNKLNEVMKLLTIFMAIFVPLSFIASLYGMNFRPEASPFNMPETMWRYGYPFALGLMLLVAGSLLYYFRRRGWI